MKKTIVLIALFFLNTQLFSQTHRRVMIEEFTQASCPPCGIINLLFDALLHANEEKVTVLKYQVAWPGYDPFNEHNPGDVQQRKEYYNVNFVPRAILEGLEASDPLDIDQTTIDSAHAELSPLKMDLEHYVNSSLDSIRIRLNIQNVMIDTFFANNTSVRFAIVEKEINFFQPVGTNGEKDFYYVMRKLVPNPNGLPLENVAAGDSTTITVEAAIPDYIYNYGAVAVVAFVQNDDTKYIYQSAISEPLTFVAGTHDASVRSNSITPEGLCDGVMTPIATVHNRGDLDITSFDIRVTLNGYPLWEDSWTGTLTTGDSIDFVLDELTLPLGRSSLFYTLSNVNGLPDYNSRNNRLQKHHYALRPEGQYNTMWEMNENDQIDAYPSNAIAEPPLDVDFVYGTLRIVGPNRGGYGQSEKSIFVNFFEWNPDALPNKKDAKLTYQGINLTDATHPTLTFQRAAARYQDSNDRIQINVSTDCAETWTTVYDRQGAEIATVDEPQNYSYTPASNEWETDTIDLRPFIGYSNVNIQFRFLSDYGNNLYIDNIFVREIPLTSSKEENPLANQVFVYPNPTSDVVTIDFQLTEKTNVCIEVYDVAGKLIQTLVCDQNYDGGGYKKKWNVLEYGNGVYYIKITTELGSATKRVLVME